MFALGTLATALPYKSHNNVQRHLPLYSGIELIDEKECENDYSHVIARFICYTSISGINIVDLHFYIFENP